MKTGIRMTLAGLFLVSILLAAPPLGLAQESGDCVDKERCAEMLRFGQEAYARGRYLDAKEYFRKAVQADPSSMEAWQYYDQAVVFALAERVEQETDLTFPAASRRGVEQVEAEAQAPPPPPPPKPVMPEPPKPGEFRIMHDEGC